MDLILKQAAEAILKSQRLIVTTHVHPDGDAIGSSTALYLALKELGKSVLLVLDDSVPESFYFLKGSRDFILPEDTQFGEDVTLILLDCADVRRAGEKIYKVISQCGTIINIDHHEGNNNYGTINCIDIEAAATGEIVYKLLKLFTNNINDDIANALYTALTTDTGSFMYDNTTEKSFLLARELVLLGASISKIRTNIWESKSEDSLRLMADILATLTVTYNSKVSYIVATKEILTKYNVHSSELEGIINYPKSIIGVAVAIFFKEISDKEVRVSFRAKDEVDVRTIANRFGGGGHKKAAGCSINLPLETAIYEVLDYVESYIK
ncbi:MAG: bifunctional oligoribonuclease/PAP phosphatase NrnA [Bacillota bacterium]